MSEVLALSEILSELDKTLAQYDRIESDLRALSDAFGDLTHDERRYLGQSFPRICDALLRIEDHHR